MAYVLEETPQVSRYVLESEPIVAPKNALDTVAEVGLGTLDAAIPLIGGPIGWIAETGAKWGATGLGHLLNTVGALGPGVTPEDILGASKLMAQENVGNKFYQPQTELGQQAVENVGKILDVGLAPARWAGEEATRRGFPTVGEAVKDVGELAIFGLAGGAGSKVRSALKKPLPPAKFPTEGEVPPPTVPPTTPPELMSAETLVELSKAERGKVVQPPPSKVAKVSTNQKVVEELRARADALEGVETPEAGYARGHYRRTADAIVGLEKDLREVELSTLPGMKGKKGKTRQLVESLLEARKPEVPEVPVMEPDIPLSQPSKIPVTELGMQEIPGKEPVLLVNEPSGTTKVFDPTKHELIGTKDGLKPEEVPVDAQSLREDARRVSEGGIKQGEGPREGGQDLQLQGKEEGVKAGGEEGVQQVIEERIISEFDTPTLAKEEGYTLDKRPFSTEKSATVVATRLGPEWEVVKVGEKYRAAKWVEESEPTSIKVKSEIPESSSLEELARTVEVGSDISRDQALKELKSPEGPEFGVAKVGEKYYRTTSRQLSLEVDSSPLTVETLTELPSVIETIHMSKGPLNISKFPSQRKTDRLDNVFGQGIYSAFPEDINMWKSMDRLVLGKTENVLEISPKNPIVITPTNVKEIIKTAKKEVGTVTTNAWFELWIEEKLAKDKDAVIIKGFKESELSELIQNLDNEFTNLFEDKITSLRRELGGTKEFSKEYEKLADKFYTEKTGLTFREFEAFSQLQNQVFVPSLKTDIVKVKSRGDLPTVSEDFVAKAMEEVRKAQKSGDRTKLAKEFLDYRDSLVEKINRARESKVEPGDLGVLDDAFRTFASKEEAIKAGRTGNLIQDPLTGRWFEEPKFESLEDLGWEQDQGDLNLKSDEIKWSDDFEIREGEISEGRVRDLWDILGNERGSGPLLVDPENLRVIRDRVKEWLRRAKKAGIGIEEYLAAQGISSKAKEEVLRVVEQLDEVNKRIKEQNPIVESIFNPHEESVLSQKVIASKKKKGTFLVEVPYTKEWEGRLRNTVNTMDRWAPNFVGNFMKFNEIPMKAFKRMGLDDLWWDWVKQESKRMDRVRDIKKEFKTLEKTLSKKEIEEISIVSEVRQKYGPEIMKEMGITEIPQLTPKQEQVLVRFTNLYEKILEEINYVRTHTGREPFPKEKNYLTRVRQFNILKSKGIIGSLANEPVETMSGFAKTFKGRYNPYSEKRVKAVDIPVELNVFSNLKRYVEFVSKDIYISPVAALAKKLSGSKVRMNPKDLTQEGSYLASLHPGAAELLRRWSDEILGVHLLNNFYKEYAGLKATSDLLHRNIVYATILFSPTTVAKQFSAWTGTIAEVGPRYTLKGIAKFATENPRSLWKGEVTRARAKSDVLKIRGFSGESYFENLHEQWLVGKVGGIKETIAKVGGIGMYLTDYITAESSWNAFYDFGRKARHMSEAEAFRFAEDRTAKTQVIGIRGATAPIQNIPGLDLFTIFQTFQIGDFNYIARDLLKIKNPEPTNLKHFIKVGRYVAAAYLINSMFQSARIDDPHPAPVETYKETKEEGGSERLAIAKAFTEYFEKLPQIGGALKYAAPLGGPVVDLMADIPVAAQAIVGAVDWNTLSKKQKIKTVLLISDVVGRSLGVPGTRSMIKSARTYAAGGNKWEVLMGIYIDTKKAKEGKLPSLKGATSLPALK